MWKFAKEVGTDMLGKENVNDLDAVMGGEDFAYYTQKVKGCFVVLGMQNEKIDAIYSVHHPCLRQMKMLSILVLHYIQYLR